MPVENSYFPSFQSPEQFQDLQGRIAIITGGACGIGCEIARALAIHNCRVIMVNAKQKQCEGTIAKIRDEIGQDAAQVEWRYCDMTDLIQVQEVFPALCDQLERLDLCIFGTGIDQASFEVDVHCIDAYFGMTWLGHWYASNLLWPLLRKTSRNRGNLAPRIIFEAPGLQGATEPDEGPLSDEKSSGLAYDFAVRSEIHRRSKASLVMGVRHGLADRISKRHGDKIYAIAIQPGKSMADPDRKPRRDSVQLPDLCDRVLDTLASSATIPLRTCSRTVIYAATSLDVEQECLNGAYLIDEDVLGRVKDPAADPSLGPGFWSISERAIRAVVGQDALRPWDACLET